MRLETDSVSEYCPYCGEPVEFVIDLSLSEQSYVEDCTVCCRPILVNVQVGEDAIAVSVRHEDEV